MFVYMLLLHFFLLLHSTIPIFQQKQICMCIRTAASFCITITHFTDFTNLSNYITSVSEKVLQTVQMPVPVSVCSVPNEIH